MRNTDFSIARILSDDRERCSPKTRRSLDEEDESPTRKLRIRFPVSSLPQAKEEQASRDRSEGETGREKYVDRVVPTETRDDALVAGETEPRDGEIRMRTDLTWLQYTRYRPPKLPRRSYVERRTKRRTDDRPRIPFSSSQLQVLEDRYRRSAYLSRNDVVEMSAMLRLPQSKVCQ